MVTKARSGSTPTTFPRPLNGLNHHHPNFAGSADVKAAAPQHTPSNETPPQNGDMPPPSSDAAPDMQAPAQGQANPQDPPNPPGESPADEEPAKQQQEEELLAQAKSIRALRSTLDLAAKGPWAEPEQPMTHWDFLLKEMRWLAVDVFQERLWKKAVAKKLALEAAAFDRKARLRPGKGNIAEEVRALCSQVSLPKEDSHRRSRKSSRDRQDVGNSAQALKEETEALNASSDAAFCYRAAEGLSAAVMQQLQKAATDAAIAQELKIREYELQYEKSVHEMRELAILARKQIAAELRGRDNTPAGDYDEEVKKNKRKRPRPSAYDDIMNGDLLPMPSKRASNLRKQQVSHSRPDSGLSEDARNVESDAVNSMPGSRRTRRRKFRDYDDDDYEETLRLRDTPRTRRPPPNQSLHRSLRSDTNKTKKKPITSTRQGSRVLDPDALAWSQVDDNLLCSIVHEFGSNWRLVADIFAMSCTLSGIHRSAAHCVKRFRELAAPHTPEGQEIHEQTALDALRINKTSARDLISKTLPLPEAVIQAHQKILLDIGKDQRDKRFKSYQNDRESGMIQQEPHETMLAVQAEALRANGGRILTPLQVVENNDAHQKALAAQHLANQQMQAAQQNAQQQAAAAAAAAAPVAPGMSGGAAVASGGSNAGVYAGVDSPTPGASAQSNGSPLQQLPAPMAQQGVQNGPVGVAKPSPGLPNGQAYGLPQAQNMPPPTTIQQQRAEMQQRILSMQQMVTTGKTQNGVDLTPEQRQSYMNQLRDYQIAARNRQSRGVGPQMAAAGQRQLPPGSIRPMGVSQMSVQGAGIPAQHPGMPNSQGMSQQGQASGGIQAQAGQALGSGQTPYASQSPQQLPGQRPTYPGQAVNSGQYAGQLPGGHMAQQQPYNGQTLAQFSPGMQSPQPVQGSQAHSAGMLSPNSQMGSQGMQQTAQGHYGVMGQGHNMNLQQRQGLGQLSSQVQGQYSSPLQNGPTNQLHTGMQGQAHGSWNPRMHAGNPSAHAGNSAGLQPGMAYHPQAAMNPALAQGQGRPHLLRPQQPSIGQHSQPHQ